MELPPYTHMHLANTTVTYPDDGGTHDTVDGLDGGESDRYYSSLSVCCDRPTESLVWFEGLACLWPETVAIPTFATVSDVRWLVNSGCTITWCGTSPQGCTFVRLNSGMG